METTGSHSIEPSQRSEARQDSEALQSAISRRMTRRTLLKQLAGLAALGMLGQACQTPQQPSSSATPGPTSAKPATGSSPAATAPPAASPVAKQITLAKRRPMKINWAAVSAGMSGVWMAHETGAWKELGIDSELTHIASSSRVAAALEAKDVEASTFDWIVVFTSVAAGGGARMVAGVTNRTIFSVIGAKAVAKPEDVKGKRWGITRVGSSTHTASLLALDVWGLKPSDVNFLQLQEVPAILSGIQAGQIDVGTVSPPTNSRAVQAGFNEIINLGEVGPEYPSIGLATTQQLIDGSPDAVLALVAGYATGVKRFRSDPERAIQVLKKYLEIDDAEMLADMQKQFSRYLPYPPVVPMESAKKVLQDAAKDEPKVANLKVEQVATTRFVDELDKNGFFK